MKTREGFVSNSSTSSFVIASPSTVFEAKLNAVHPFINHIITLARPSKQMFGGVEVTKVSDVVSTEDDYRKEEWVDDGNEMPTGWDEYEGSTRAWEEFMKMFQPDEAITISEGC
jgi:hypothetical protein